MNLRRRVFVFLMSFLMVVTCIMPGIVPRAEAAAEEQNKWPAPTDLRWGRKTASSGTDFIDGIPSDISFMAPEGARYAVVKLFKKSDYNIVQISNDFVWLYGDSYAYSGFVGERDLESGDYYFTVKIMGRDGYADSDVAVSDIWHYTKPDAQLETCTDLVWEDTVTSYTLPSNLEHVGGYELRWLYTETLDIEPESDNRGAISNLKLTCDLRDDFDEAPGYYYYQIRLLSDDISVIYHGDWSDYSEALYYDGNTFTSTQRPKLDPITNLHWEGTKLCFSDPNINSFSGEYCYQYTIYYGESAEAEPYEWAWFEEDSLIDMAELIYRLKDPELGYYYFTVQPRSKDLTQLCHGDVSGMSPAFHFYGQDLSNQPSHTHSYGDWVIIQEATITADGIRQRSCSCGETETESVPATGKTTLAQLSREEYMAFSDIAYHNFTEGKTIKECLGKKWDEPMDTNEPGITNGDMCKNFANWMVCKVLDHSDSNGFYAVAFKNPSNEVLIAYRGSKPLSGVPDLFTSEDARYDWIENDVGMIFLNAVSSYNQIADAFTIYNDVVKENAPAAIHVTGHSLGGLWAEVISANTGCRGITFNSISALDVVYANFPKQMGKNYNGLDTWNFIDHINQYDILAGASEKAFSVLGAAKLKPYILHKSDFGALSILKNHSLHSILQEMQDGAPTLTDTTGSWVASKGVSNYMNFTAQSVDMGVSGRDYFDKGLSLAVKRTSYGGNGSDTILSSIHDDTLIGGPGSDILEGGWGNDSYYYYMGDGCDAILDTGGQDALYLYGFPSDATFEIYEDPDDKFVDVYYKGNILVRICTNNREYSVLALDSFKIYVDRGANKPEEYDITSAFERYTYGSHLLIRCPVDVQILDANGNVVHTVKDGEVSRTHNEYGSFYVFQEDDGGYGKAMSLAEGYTVQVVGVGTGTMDIEYYDVKSGELAEAQVMEDIPVYEGYTAKLEETKDGSLQLVPETGNTLWGDVNGDGWVDSYDAALILKYDVMLIGDADLNLAAADVSGDGFVDSYDASLILKFDVMLIDKFPAQG